MWNPEKPPLNHRLFPTLDPKETLYEFDGPRIFTILDADGELNLAYWSDESDEFTRYVVVPTSPGIIQMLKDGQISVWDALDQPRSWICDTRPDGQVAEVYRVDFDSLPPDTLPAPSVMLLPSLEPLLTLRAVGKSIVPGAVPGSVLRSCVEGVQKSFKFLSEYVLGMNPQRGRPDEFMRHLFDLPTQRVAFRSFEIGFRMPLDSRALLTSSGEKTPESETLDQVGGLLVKGLNWLKSAAGEEGIYSAANPAEGESLFRALKELTPSSQGNIERIELSGRLFGPMSTPYLLNQSDRLRVNAAIRNRSLEPKLLDLQGRIRELDRDRLSFELREIGSAEMPAQRFVFDEELLEDVFQAFQDERRVRVAARTFPVRNVAYAIAISSPNEDPASSATS